MPRAAATARIAVLFAFALASGCGDAPSPPPGARTLAEEMHAYVTDPAFRRQALEQSLVSRDNAYARLRLERYDETTWGALPEHNPKTAPIESTEEGREPERTGANDRAWAALDVDATGWSEAELRALGERAFFRYPAQTAHALPNAVSMRDRAGVWEHRGELGAVWVSEPRGVVTAAVTCATCHASKRGDELIVGRNNADLDAAGVLGDRGARWGRGRVDVTDDGIDNPVTIADLRPVRYQLNLHRAATLRNSPAALAVRIETLLITSANEAVRPPRKVAAALAVYLLSLAPTSPLPAGSGAQVFARDCARCHRGEGATGPAVSLDVVGTDPSVGASPDRGTGFYRVPSLRAVGDRRALFATGAVAEVDALLSPARPTPGHRFGLDLSADDRAALLSYLRGL